MTTLRPSLPTILPVVRYSDIETPFNISLNETEITTGNGTCPDPYPRDEELAKVEIGIQAVVLILALVGNSTVLLVLALRKKKLSRMHMFIMHLSLADLFVAFFNILPQMAWDVTYRFQGGDFLCRFVKFIQIVAMYASSYVLVATALDRYTAIVYPLTSHTWTQRRIVLMVGMAWILSMAFSIPQPIMFSYRPIHPNSSCLVFDCWAEEADLSLTQAYVTIFLSLVYFIPLLILIFCYGRICCIVWHSIGARETPSPSARPNTPHILSKEATKGLTMQYEEKLLRKAESAPRAHARGISNAKMKTIKLTLAVILCYQICWSPFFISNMYWAWHPNPYYTGHFMTIVVLLASLNSMTNPWIYLMFNDNICQQMKTRYKPHPTSYYSEYRTSSTKLGASVSQSEYDKDRAYHTNSLPLKPMGSPQHRSILKNNSDNGEMICQ